MKRLLILIGTLFLTTSALSNPGAQHFEGSDAITEEVPCLGIFVNVSVSYQGVTHSFYDNSGGWHTMVSIILNGQYDAVGSDMSWTLRRGGGRFIQNSNDNGQFMQINEGHEVALANGNYPNLMFSYRLSATFNANGELVSFRFAPESYRCVGN